MSELLKQYGELMIEWERAVASKATYPLWVSPAAAMIRLVEQMTEAEQQQARAMQVQAYARRIG